jgi:hypothetical protein
LYVPRNFRWIDEDASANDPAHHQHGGIERAQPTN